MKFFFDEGSVSIVSTVERQGYTITGSVAWHDKNYALNRDTNKGPAIYYLSSHCCNNFQFKDRFYYTHGKYHP
jgi:DNA-binding winged helix-turn-helix (wHTH) protein